MRKVAGSVGRRVSRELEARVEIQSTVLLTTNSLRPAQLLISLPNSASVIFPSISTQTCVCVCDRLILSSDFRPCFLFERAPPNKLGEEKYVPWPCGRSLISGNRPIAKIAGNVRQTKHCCSRACPPLYSTVYSGLFPFKKIIQFKSSRSKSQDFVQRSSVQ